MKRFLNLPLLRTGLRPVLSLAFALSAAAALLCQSSAAQVPDRIAPSFSASQLGPLKASLHPLARPAFDQGRASSVTKVPNMTLVFAPSAAQRTALTALLSAQQNPASPSYHKWLTTAQYAAQFGMSSHDLATTEAWLESQGFVVLSVSNGHDAIHFSGTVAQVEAAFHTEMHQYVVKGTTHLANATVLSLPSALTGSVAGVRGIAQFRPRAMHSAMRHPSAETLKAQYTSSVSGDHYLAPSDITTIYDIKALYNAGYTGTGQSIAIVGQSAISTTDLENFETAAGLPIKDPTLVLVPNTGTSAVTDSDDEGESDIDLEWSSAIAPGATVNFVYTGNDTNTDVFDAVSYAIDNTTAPIISISYGECEIDASSDTSVLEPLFMKANAQGQTILSSAGDQGATGCDQDPPATQGLAVNYPSSSAYVTAMGGTEFNEGTVNYWNTTNDSLGGSAISYIPEAVWNETEAVITADTGTTATPELTSTGGGVSTLFGKPSWQVATNVPADGARDVPDISLDAAVLHDGFLLCSTGECTSGFRDASSDLDVAGGTSFDAPIFAGILALIEQKTGATTGLGNVNPQLYALSSTATTAFHDIVVGDNEQPCESGSIDCATGTTEIGYAAGTGYDLATGLGSIDAYLLAQAFTPPTVVSGSVIATTTTLTPSTSTPVTGTAVTFTAAVAASSGTTVPTGTVNFVVDGGTAVPVTLTSGTGSGTASYAATFTTTGTHSVVATYAGDATFAASTANLTTTVASSTTTGSFTLAATNVTVASGDNADSTLTITGANGYTGVVGLAYDVTPTFSGCLFANDIGVGTNGTVTSSIVVDTLASDCVSSGSRHMLARKNAVVAATHQGNQPPSNQRRSYPIAVAALLAGLALLRGKRKVWPAAMVLLLAGLGTLSGCGGNSGTPITTPSSGTTYTFTLTGTDTLHTTLTASTTFTVIVN